MLKPRSAEGKRLFMQPARRSYSKPFKALIIQKCAQPGVSITNVAFNQSLNGNLVHKWIRLQSADKHSPTTFICSITRVADQCELEPARQRQSELVH